MGMERVVSYCCGPKYLKNVKKHNLFMLFNSNFIKLKYVEVHKNM